MSLLSSAVFIILATLPCTKESMFNNQPQFVIEAENNKAFDNSTLIRSYEIKAGNIAKCLEHCLENCACQSFQVCQNTICQLCSSNKEDNSSLLHDKDGCIYAVYKMRQSPGALLKAMEGQCSDMSCSMKYNCCQQSGLCPENKICKPANFSLEQPWKRFTCECPDGYHGEKCNKRITSCQGYSNVSSGMHALSSDGLMYEVYCHFEADNAWTLVQSYSFSNKDLLEFSKPLYEDFPLSENNLTWSGYRLGKSRMETIKEDSTLLRFTCDHQLKNRDINASDYLQISLDDLPDVLIGPFYEKNLPIRSGKIRGVKVNNCEFWLSQHEKTKFFGWFARDSNKSACSFPQSKSSDYCKKIYYFCSDRNYCLGKTYRCLADSESTLQLWFGR